MVVLGILFALVLAALLIVPQFLINWTMNANSVERPDFPGTGAELARELLDKAGLSHVKVEQTGPMQDHYSVADKAVRLSEKNYQGRSVTAVAVAAHECAHAVQDRDGYRPLQLRQQLVGYTIAIQRTGTALLMASPIVFLLTRSPAVLVAELLVGLVVMSSTVVIQLITLPTELDASFRRALPALTHYLAPQDMPGAKSVLRAAAFTYVAGAMISLLNIGRWLRLLRF